MGSAEEREREIDFLSIHRLCESRGTRTSGQNWYAVMMMVEEAQWSLFVGYTHTPPEKNAWNWLFIRFDLTSSYDGLVAFGLCIDRFDTTFSSC